MNIIDVLKCEYDLTKQNLRDEIDFVEREISRGRMNIREALDHIEYRFDELSRAYRRYSENVSIAHLMECESRYNFWRGYHHRAVHHLKNRLKERMEEERPRENTPIVITDDEQQTEENQHNETTAPERNHPIEREKTPYERKISLLKEVSEIFQQLADIEVEIQLSIIDA